MTTRHLKNKKYLNQETFRLDVCKVLTTELSHNCINCDITEGVLQQEGVRAWNTNVVQRTGVFVLSLINETVLLSQINIFWSHKTKNTHTECKLAMCFITKGKYHPADYFHVFFSSEVQMPQSLIFFHFTTLCLIVFSQK